MVFFIPAARMPRVLETDGPFLVHPVRLTTILLLGTVPNTQSLVLVSPYPLDVADDLGVDTKLGLLISLPETWHLDRSLDLSLVSSRTLETVSLTP